MQFSTEVPSRDKEGACIDLDVQPYFFGKITATVIADILTNESFGVVTVEYPDHQMA